MAHDTKYNIYDITYINICMGRMMKNQEFIDKLKELKEALNEGKLEVSDCEICGEEMFHHVNDDPECCSQECHDRMRQNGKCNWRNNG